MTPSSQRTLKNTEAAFRRMQRACENERPENLRVMAATNPHSPGKYRINGVVVNMPEFAAAFQCKAQDPLVNKPENVCKVW